ncbi:hypothetical protein TL16_g04770 [Triparma laevis f. inornata]|uniref:Uncharacterized protein n=2 Tax=Triparma laevis TaxID=1534972 RepID=A0A9W7FK58_9STRA|nr:hypothetical protein TL16_g04770 [Triparma laevis f. inornata]GMI13540.1 hypothetical protein TrLO_g6790 [Triparma laevis f. longispina]
MPPRAQKKKKRNEEGGGGDVFPERVCGTDVFSDEVKVEALVAVKQGREQDRAGGNPQENNVEEIQAEESSMSMLLKEMRSVREEMKGLQEKTRKEIKGVKGEMVNRSEETGQKMESVFEELISVKDELREARKDITALKPRDKFQSNKELKAAARLWCTDRNKAIAKYGHISSWNVSSITSMVLLFGMTTEEIEHGNRWNKDFNQDISL